MRVLRGFLELEPLDAPTAVSIGNFDGVHRGHQAVVGSAVEDARQHGGRAVVCTFHPHTRAVVSPRRRPELLQTLDQRLEVLGSLGVDDVVVIPFDETVARTPAASFVDGFLRDRLRVRALHVSGGFRFGRGGAGDVELLRKRAPAAGFTLTVVPPVIVDGEPVSSTRIRQALREGRVGDATTLLGRPHAVAGRVVQGAGRGRSLQARTANLDVAGVCLPAHGVYVSRLVHGELAMPAVSNIGRRPTFGGGEVTVEAHVLEAEGGLDLYGETVSLELLQRLRGEIAFDSPTALAAQIQRDVEQALAWFGS